MKNRFFTSAGYFLRKRRITVSLLAALVAVSSSETGAAGRKIIQYPILSRERLELTGEYAKRHYGINSPMLKNPKIIVIHYTGIHSLKKSLSYFKPAKIWAHRQYIGKFGMVNVGVHYIVARDGTIYSLLPTGIMGRHAIGFNHVSLGIENVAAGENDLTEHQLDANARLVNDLVKKHPTIDSLAGHHEYTDQRLYHYRYFLRMDRKYIPTIKSDPGAGFMERLRQKLKSKYGLVLNR